MAEATPGGGPSACALHPEVPALGACQHCGTFACGRCLGMLGGRRICATCVREGRVTVYGVPWERRKEHGLLRAWWRTVWVSWTDPVGFFQRTDPRGPVGESFLFAMTSVALLLLLWLGLAGGIGGLIAIAMIAEGSVGATEIGVVAAVAGFYALLFPLGVAAQLVISPLIHHPVLLVLGGGRQGLGATYRVQLYSAGIAMLSGIPCLNYVTWIWLAVVHGIGYSFVHGQEGWRSAVAVIVPILLACGCCGAFYALVILSEL